jgi:hypothetical protein
MPKLEFCVWKVGEVEVGRQQIVGHMPAGSHVKAIDGSEFVVIEAGISEGVKATLVAIQQTAPKPAWEVSVPFQWTGD